MKNINPSDLMSCAGRVAVISTDVFDTLLIRTSRSERTRIFKGEQLFSALLAQHGWRIPVDVLVNTRLQAQRLAFRGLSLRKTAGEVRLSDIIYRQLAILGVPQSMAEDRLRIEQQVEKASLVGNQQLARILRAHRMAGKRIIAISDTTLSGPAVEDLVRHFHGPHLVDRVYSSADYGLTKRKGDLFLAAAQAENVSLSELLHIGDDLLADVKMPTAKGITARHLQQPSYRRYLRAADALVTESKRFVRGSSKGRTAEASSADPSAFGRIVLGPIVVQFCLLIWAYASEARASGTASLMFCARGGIGIREAFERVIARLGLPLDMPRENLMISRLVAARAAILAQRHSAIEELDREFKGSSFAEVAAALGGRNYELSQDWQGLFTGQHFLKLLFGHSGTEVFSDIKKQNELFARHLGQLAKGADRIILCDTGLYASTQRLLADGFPALRIETIQFARSNYKGHGEEHFAKVTGLMVEQDVYSPLNVHSCVLRYWHLIESLFEPAVPSARLFSEKGGQVAANCGDITFGKINPAANNPLLRGALDYIESLPPNGGATALNAAEAAWRRLRQAITRPTDAELKCLEVAGRSVDFGRPDILQIFTPAQHKGFMTKLALLKAQLWREGTIAREFPYLKHALLPLLGTAHSMRGLLAELH
ncbi:MAG: hydrolase [Ramlibacter sp.]|nr:hydrolase [Ramlibacter sp.]